MSTQGLQQVQKQTQNLVLAPQLRQSLKILQVPALELRNTIIEELQTNPALEELAMEGISIEAQNGDSSELNESDDPSETSSEMDFGEDYSILHKLDEDWREHFSQENSGRAYTSEDEARRKHFFDSLVSETSLQEHLLQQAELSELSEDEMQAMHYIIGSLDDHGFLTSEPQDIAMMSNLSLKCIQDALARLKSFDPPGIGSRDLPECLLFQLTQKGLGKSLAAEIIRDHYKLLLRRRIPELARKTGTDAYDVQKAIEDIAELDPAPGRKFSEDNNRVIVPDVTIERDGDQWVINLNNDYIPRLRLSSTYKELIAKGKLNSQEKEYIREKIRSGKFLISSIEQRQQTLERIAREILDMQRDFFEHGVSHLRPLTMNQVAERVGVHETTVSRAIANKYIDTPYGIYEFKYFFTPGYQGNNGEAVSNTSIKEEIAQIIEAEDPSKPLSDQAIVKILADKDFNIARRTVAKYREELGILPTNLRRRYR